jgi:hypothetical protein
MIENRYTIAEIADMLEVSKDSIRKIAGVVPGAEKLHNVQKVLCWTFPPESVPAIAKMLNLEVEESSQFNDDEYPNSATKQGGQEEANPLKRPGVNHQTSGLHSKKKSTTEEKTPWELLAILGVLIVLVFSHLKR